MTRSFAFRFKLRYAHFLQKNWLIRKFVSAVVQIVKITYNFKKEKINGTTSITNIIDFAPVFSKLFESLEEKKPDYNQPQRRSLRDHSDEEPDYDIDYYGDYSTSSIVKQLTKESLTVQRRVSCQNKQFRKIAFFLSWRERSRSETICATKRRN